MRLSAELRSPRQTTSVYSWSLSDIFAARNAQLAGQFQLPARMAESMRTDDALSVAYENRLAPQRCIRVGLEPANSTARAASVCGEAEALFGQAGVGIHPDTVADINGCLVNHGIAIGYNIATPREDGSRVDYEHKSWPIEFVRWDTIDRCFKARVDPMGQPAFIPAPTKVEGESQAYQSINFWEEPIVHGDGRWVVYKKHDIYPWREEAALLSACLVWARHAFASRDWSKGSVSHGNAKVVGEMPEGMPLQKVGGGLTDEASAFLELLRAIASADTPIGIRPSGAKTDFLTNNSTAWQVWKELVLNAEKAAARIYLGTDGTLGTQGGAPGIDISALFGVATTKVEGDLRCIERGILTGVIEPWCAMNFGDSTLAPRRTYQIPDADEEKRTDARAKRYAAFWLNVTSAHDSGIVLDQSYVNAIAEDYDVPPPTLPPGGMVLSPPVAGGDPKPDPKPKPHNGAAATLRLVQPPSAEPAPSATAQPETARSAPPAPEPSPIEKAEHSSRMTAALIADIREARQLGLEYTQAQIDETAARYGVPAPKVGAK